jgi:ABC-type antimicrobial peptide transport system permease subunit
MQTRNPGGSAVQPRVAIAPPQGHGFSGFQICWRHLLPNLAPLIIAQATVSFGYVMVDLAAISFLGLGVQPPSPTATVPPAAD